MSMGLIQRWRLAGGHWITAFELHAGLGDSRCVPDCEGRGEWFSAENVEVHGDNNV